MRWDALVAQSNDVMAAVAYVAALPYVDKRRIAVAGCSLGGIESLLTAERGTGITAAVDFAGAAITWANNLALQDRMKLAAATSRSRCSSSRPRTTTTPRPAACCPRR
jgi:dienelactone hydrolase